jgi:SAM-dependent methyltransferase
MNQDTTKSIAKTDFTLSWVGPNATHTDRYLSQSVNFWRDILPEKVSRRIIKLAQGESIDTEFNPGEMVPALSQKNRFSIKPRQFDTRFRDDALTLPRAGRFYPKGMLKDMTNIFRVNMQPFRCLSVDSDHIMIDFNHPLANRHLKLNVQVNEIVRKDIERGGTSNAWLELLTEGPGMQSRINGSAVDFFSDNPFARVDESPDALFYQAPRFVNHLDDHAISVVQNLYGSLFKEGSQVLDLMSSWTSHLPDNFDIKDASGLGMNQAELDRNVKLTDRVVQDLNQNTALPYKSNAFDAVICTASVEYLIRPFEVFREVHRVLKPGGVFITTFSNRWFPPKAIRIWKELHDFEKMSLVLEYFLESGLFENLETHSTRGLPRPDNDKYADKLKFSDPVYAVWGYKK